MATLVLAIATVLIAVGSLALALVVDRRTARASRIAQLLGEKETVAFGASRLMIEGFPREGRHRHELVLAVLHACLFEGSDRARGMLLAAVESHRKGVPDLVTELDRLRDTYRGMEHFDLDRKELDLTSARLRLLAIRKVLDPAVAPERWWPVPERPMSPAAPPP